LNNQPQLIVSVPGRAEIIGNHTDYNNGLALAAAIAQRTEVKFSGRNDRIVSVKSTNFPSDKPWEFHLDKITKDKMPGWVNYVKGVADELQKAGYKLGGADIDINGKVPISGGVSSSAALELAILTGFNELYGLKIEPMQGALLAQKAENKFVGSNCGLLDQATITNAKKDQMVLMDFDQTPAGVKAVKASLPGYTFMVVADPKIGRVLGETGYNVRRAKCEESHAVLAKLLNKKVTSLRDVTEAEFKQIESQLIDEVMKKRVCHIVTENQRVVDSVSALESGDAKTFLRLINESGRSALGDYELDEQCPSLTFLCQTMWQLGEKYDAAGRNMGGGFNPMGLAVVADKDKDSFKRELSQKYQKQFKHELEFIEFTPAEGIKVEQSA
jgi:galactokinase